MLLPVEGKILFTLQSVLYIIHMFIYLSPIIMNFTIKPKFDAYIMPLSHFFINLIYLEILFKLNKINRNSIISFSLILQSITTIFILFSELFLIDYVNENNLNIPQVYTYLISFIISIPFLIIAIYITKFENEEENDKIKFSLFFILNSIILCFYFPFGLLIKHDKINIFLEKSR
jgi:hypothetical protein